MGGLLSLKVHMLTENFLQKKNRKEEREIENDEGMTSDILSNDQIYSHAWRVK